MSIHAHDCYHAIHHVHKAHATLRTGHDVAYFLILTKEYIESDLFTRIPSHSKGLTYHVDTEQPRRYVCPGLGIEVKKQGRF